MAATTMLSLDGATHQNPRGLLSYASVTVSVAASVTLVHNLGQAQSRNFTRNELLVNWCLVPRLGAIGVLAKLNRIAANRYIRYRHVNANTIKLVNLGATVYTVNLKILALHSAVK